MAGPSPNDRGALLYIENLSKSYGRNSVISGLTVSFPSTGLHIIAGDNGTGKTTLFKCIAGLEGYRGSVKWDDGTTRGRVSTAFDDSPSHDGLSGLQNLSAILDRPIRQLRADSSTFRFLSKEGLEKKTRSYSLGQRKKLSLTAVFLDAMPCALLDEPTSGLDVSGRKELASQLESAARTRCIIVSDHYVDFYVGLASTSYSFGAGGLHKAAIGSLASPGGAEHR